ncbi:zinc finger protein GIS2-like [Vicia villosa]|uniref:zinc finger protein GIS2-like n=1 Tax=Vicia villosa TaxID=3911 RepID=UPI00273BFA5C|nr:zinc finger protein GIS2-like [Vicia villosa]
MDRGKPYGSENPKAGDWKRPSGGDSSAPVSCFKYGEVGHRRNECKSEEKKYFNSGKMGHIAFDCRMKSVTCYNCNEEGHNNPQCTKPKKNQAGGKVFALSGSETTPEDQLIKAAGAKDLEMTARQVGEAIKDVAAVFMLFASMELKGKVVSSELPVVREYPEELIVIVIQEEAN